MSFTFRVKKSGAITFHMGLVIYFFSLFSPSHYWFSQAIVDLSWYCLMGYHCWSLSSFYLFLLSKILSVSWENFGLSVFFFCSNTFWSVEMIEFCKQRWIFDEAAGWESLAIEFLLSRCFKSFRFYFRWLLHFIPLTTFNCVSGFSV